jgi:hypothetical protein
VKRLGFLARWCAGPLAIVLVVGTLVAGTAARAAAAGTTYKMLVTLYGWDDNSPPGCAIAYPDIHSCAGGTGTYANPITFATDDGELPKGTIVYYAPLDRYFIMEDDCTECDEDWTGHGPDGGPGYRHIDLWAGGASGDNSNALYNCEDNWTSNSQASVIVGPPSNEPVADQGRGGPVFDVGNGSCWTVGSGGGPSTGGGSGTTTTIARTTTTTSPGTSAGGGTSAAAWYNVVNKKSGSCVGATARGMVNGTFVQQWACRPGRADEQWQFKPTASGSFKVLDRRAVPRQDVWAVPSGAGATASGTKIRLLSYSGQAGQQWDRVPLGGGYYRFMDRKSGLCLEVPGGSVANGARLQQYVCNGAKAEAFRLVRRS